MADPKRFRDFVDSHDRGIAPAVLEAADILLTEPGEVGEALLRQAPLLPDPFDVATDENAHVHARNVNGLTEPSLSTIICNQRSRWHSARSMLMAYPDRSVLEARRPSHVRRWPQCQNHPLSPFVSRGRRG